MPTSNTSGPEDFDPSRHPRKLNLGSGSDKRPDYLNVDMNAWHQPDLVADICRLGFLPSLHYDEILAQDVLEHLPRTETLRTLLKWNRPLRIGGRIVIRVPSVIALAERMAAPANQSAAAQEELMQCLFGTQAYTGDFHLTSFTRPLLEHYLGSAGFVVQSLELVHGWLFDVVAVKDKHIEVSPLRDFAELLEIRDDEDFVRTCYREILQRDADAGGMEYYLGGMRDGGMTRQVVIDAMLGGEEYRHLRRE